MVVLGWSGANGGGERNRRGWMYDELSAEL